MMLVDTKQNGYEPTGIISIRVNLAPTLPFFLRSSVPDEDDAH